MESEVLMATTWDHAIAEVLESEGVLSEDPRDTGGVTKYGISAQCIAPECRVLTSDLRWVPAGSLVVGDRLLGFDEHPERHGKLNVRRFRETVVEEAGPVRLPASRITTERTSFVASDGHQWLRRWGKHCVFNWSTTGELLTPPGRWTNGAEARIGTLFPPWDVIQSREAGYLAGVLDGEGSISNSLEFAQKVGNALVEQALACADALGLQFRPGHLRHGVSSYRLVGGEEPFYHIVVAGRLGAGRLLKRAAARLIGRSIASTKARHDRVLSVESIGDADLIGVTTSTKTLIVEGYLSHNSYPHLDIRSLTRQEAIDIYRRDYWAKTGALIEDINPPLAIALFDFGVNSGPATAVTALQKTLGVQADGVIGPKTRAAIEKADDSLLIRFLAERLLLMATFKTFPVHGRGWYRRVAGLGYRLGRMEAAQGMDDARTLIDALVRTARALGVLK
jgi:lysozyme family protein